MIAISSIRPLDKDDEYKENQIVAYSSWHNVFSRIIYYSTQAELAISGPNVNFIPITEEFPTIQDMVWMASLQSELTAIINADIVVGDSLLKVPGMMREANVFAVTSRRYNFDKGNMKDAVVDDRGADFFMAQPNIWRHVSRLVPNQLRFGQPTWDHWMVGFFWATLGRQFRNITAQRAIFHPRHEGRITMETARLPDLYYLNSAHWPDKL